MNIHSTRQGNTLNRNAIATRSQDKVVGSESETTSKVSTEATRNTEESIFPPMDQRLIDQAMAEKKARVAQARAARQQAQRADMQASEKADAANKALWKQVDDSELRADRLGLATGIGTAVAVFGGLAGLGHLAGLPLGAPLLGAAAGIGAAIGTGLGFSSHDSVLNGARREREEFHIPNLQARLKESRVATQQVIEALKEEQSAMNAPIFVRETVDITEFLESFKKRIQEN